MGLYASSLDKDPIFKALFDEQFLSKLFRRDVENVVYECHKALKTTSTFKLDFLDFDDLLDLLDESLPLWSKPWSLFAMVFSDKSSISTNITILLPSLFPVSSAE